jgi:hypothetical protein
VAQVLKLHIAALAVTVSPKTSVVAAQHLENVELVLLTILDAAATALLVFATAAEPVDI